jgi:hypothetical protein
MPPAQETELQRAELAKFLERRPFQDFHVFEYYQYWSTTSPYVPPHKRRDLYEEGYEAGYKEGCGENSQVVEHNEEDIEFLWKDFVRLLDTERGREKLQEVRTWLGGEAEASHAATK